MFIIVDRIYKLGLNPVTKQYNIPKELSSNAETILQQLKLLEKLFPNNDSKLQMKTENPQGSQSFTVDKSRNCDKRSTSSQPTTSTAKESKNDSSLAKKQKITRNIKDYIPVVVEKGKMAQKLEAAAPYNFFLTAITDAKPTHNESLTVTMQGKLSLFHSSVNRVAQSFAFISEILDESLGDIESSVQINFMVDIGWLLGHYYFAGIL